MNATPMHFVPQQDFKARARETEIEAGDGAARGGVRFVNAFALVGFSLLRQVLEAAHRNLEIEQRALQAEGSAEGGALDYREHTGRQPHEH